jgi:hypothetical protein
MKIKKSIPSNLTGCGLDGGLVNDRQRRARPANHRRGGFAPTPP